MDIGVIEAVIGAAIGTGTIVGSLAGYMRWLVRHEIRPIAERLDATEKQVLRHQVLTFTLSLRDGHKPSMTEFRNIYHDIDRYIHIGGNMFVRNEKAFIDRIYEEIYGAPWGGVKHDREH